MRAQSRAAGSPLRLGVSNSVAEGVRVATLVRLPCVEQLALGCDDPCRGEGTVRRRRAPPIARRASSGRVGLVAGAARRTVAWSPSVAARGLASRVLGAVVQWWLAALTVPAAVGASQPGAGAGVPARQSGHQGRRGAGRRRVE